MQDRQHINNDPLVDRGWAQMQAQLEEVMPVQKRRIFPWWILLLSIGLVSSLGAYGWMSFYGNTTVDTPNEQKIKKLEVPMAQIEPKETFINTENNTSTENTSNTAKILPPSSSARQENVVGNENQIQSKQHFAASTPPAKEENKKLLKEAISSSTEPVKAAENTLNEEALIPALPKTIDLIPALETTEIALLKENMPSIEKEVAFSAPKKAHLIIETGTETGFGGNPQGVSLGLAYQHRINNKMDYEIDLSYQAVSIDLFSGALSLKSNNELNGLSSQGSGTGFFPTLSVAQAYNQLRINKMNLGISASRKLGARWSLGLGTQVSYFAKAIIPISINSFVDTYEENMFDANIDPFNETIQVYAFDSVSNLVMGDTYQLELKRWQLSALLQAHYRISKHWEVEASYRKALTKWPDNKNTYGANSFIGLGLRYYVW